MSLSSWALVMAHHRAPDNVRAGYIYLVMASFGTLALLLAFGLLAGTGGGYAFADHACAAPFSCYRCAGALPDPARRRLQGRARAAARLASARASGSPQPRFRADERRHDQGRRLCLRAHRVRPARRSGVVVEHARAGARRHHLRDGRAVCADAARPQAALGLSYGGEYRDHLHRT